MWVDTKALVLLQVYILIYHTIDDNLVIFLLIFYSHKKDIPFKL